MIAKLETQDYDVINGVLRTIHSIIRKYTMRVVFCNVIIELRFDQSI